MLSDLLLYAVAIIFVIFDVLDFHLVHFSILTEVCLALAIMT